MKKDFNWYWIFVNIVQKQYCSVEINNIVFNYLKNNNGEINYKNNEIKFIFGLLIKNKFDNKKYYK